MSSICTTLYQGLTHRYTVAIAVILFAIYLCQTYGAEEDFDTLNPIGQVVNIPTGIYQLRNVFGTISSQLLTNMPVVDTNNIVHQTGDSLSNVWAFKKVTDGVYLIRKPMVESSGAQCLYTGNDQQIRGYLVQDPKICGMETLTQDNQLDPYSIRLYFKLSSAPNETFVIQSLQNNMYLSYDGQQLHLRSSPDQGSYFKVSSI